MMAVCEEWWAITKDPQALFDLYKIFNDSNTRKIIRKTLILECVIVVTSAFFIQQEQYIPLPDTEQTYLQKRLIRLYYLAHQNLLHIICLVLQRMGQPNYESNMWAIHLKTLVQEKINIPQPFDALTMTEESRREEFTRNNHKIYKYLKQLQGLQERRTVASRSTIIFTNIAYVNQEIEKMHINKVREMLLQALN